MAGNGGMVQLKPFKCKFQYAEGTRPYGAPRSVAGTKVEMNWNQAIMAEAQGHGKMQTGPRPHHNRPSLMGRKAAEHELQPDDGLDSVERARLRVKAAASGGKGSPSASGSSATPKQQRRDPVMPVRNGHRPLELSKMEWSTPMAAVRESQNPTEPAVKEHQKEALATQATPSQAGRTQVEEDAFENSSNPVVADDRWELAAEANDAIAGVSRAWRLLRMRLESGKVGSSTASVVKISDSVLYVGETMKKAPHGQGVLFLADGAQHAGNFKHGRADGPGAYLTAQGIASQGSWVENKRVGDFMVLDSKGVTWIEKYNEDGKKTSRKKSEANQESATSSKSCVECRHKFHTYFNHSYACRKHSANWVLDRDQSGDGSAGVWACCGAQNKEDPGCAFSSHVASNSDDV